MRRRAPFTCFAFIVAVAMMRSLFGQAHLEWVKTYSLDQSRTNRPSSILLSPDASIFVSGSSANASGNLDYAAIKYASNGDLLWVRRFDDAGADDQLRRAVTDLAGNIYLTGTTKTISYDPIGNLRWIQPYAGRDLTTDSNYVYITGFSDTDCATAKLRGVNGTNIWSVTANGFANTNEISQALALDKEGNLFVAGSETWYCDRSGCYQQATVSIYDPAGVLLRKHYTSANNMARDQKYSIRGLLLDSNGSTSMVCDELYHDVHFWTIKYTPDLAEQWYWFLDKDDVVKYGGAVNDAIIDGGDNIYMAGRRNYVTDGIIEIIKLVPDGHKAWRREIAASFPGVRDAVAVRLDSLNFAYVAITLPSERGDTDIGLVKYDNDGNQIWMKLFDSVNHANDLAASLVLDKAGNIYVTGYSETAAGGTEFVTLKYSEFPKIAKKTNGTMNIQFMTNPNSAYTLQATTNFFDWKNLLTNNADATGFVQFDDTEAPTVPFRLYRGKSAP